MSDEPPVGSIVRVGTLNWTRTLDGWQPVERPCIDWGWLNRMAAVDRACSRTPEQLR